MKTNKETVEKLYTALQFFYPWLFNANAVQRAVKKIFDYHGEKITSERFKDELLAWAQTEDDLAYAIRKLKEEYQKLPRVEATRPGTEELKTLEEQARIREEAQRAAKEKGVAQTEEFLDQQQKRAERLKEILKNKAVYAKVEAPKPEKLTPEEQKAYDDYKNAIKADPDKIKAAENLAQEIKIRVAPSLTEQGATEEEIKSLSEQTAKTLVEKMVEESAPAYVPVGTQAAILSSVANDTKVVAKVVGDKAAESVVKTTANNVAVFKIYPDQIARNITTIAFGERFSETIFGVSPGKVRVELSDVPTPGFTQTVNFGELNQTHAELQNNQSQTLGLIKQLGEGQAKSFLLKQTGTFLEGKIASLPTTSVAGKILRTPEAQSLFFSTFGVGTAVKWEATNWVGGLALKFAPESAPLLSAFGKFTGINLVKPAITQAVSQATTKVAAGLLPKVFAAVGALGSWASFGLSIAAGWILGKIAEKIPWDKVKKALPYIVGALLFPFFGPIAAVAGGVGTAVLGGATLAGVGAGIGAFFWTLGRATTITIGAPIIVTLLVFPVVVALILFIINSGAYVVPPAPLFEGSGTITSPYIDVIKTPNPGGPFQNSDLPLTVDYSVSIKAKKGTLSNVQIDYSCNVVKKSSSTQCPEPDPAIPTNVDSVSPAQAFTFSYKQTYDALNFQDSFVTDVITVTADVVEQSGTQAAGSATIKIGEPPEDCPSIWPTNSGYITQGAYTPPSCGRNCSHSTTESIDIGVSNTSVLAGHSGAVVTATRDSCYGNMIQIKSNCGGRDFISRYAHLNALGVRTGQSVTMGQQIGLSGNTGSCTTGPHLHYEFRYWPDGKPKWPSAPPFMMSPYIPQDVPRGCRNTAECGVSF